MFGRVKNKVIDIINDWNPPRLSNENKYRDHLLTFLRKELNEGGGPFTSPQRFSVKKEDGRGLCDIAVDREIGIELKKDLKRKSQIDRLAGQIMDYRKDYSSVIVVLVGESTEDAVEQLKDKVEDFAPQGFALGSQEVIEIIDKSHNTANQRNNKRQEGGLFVSSPWGRGPF